MIAKLCGLVLRIYFYQIESILTNTLPRPSLLSVSNDVKPPNTHRPANSYRIRLKFSLLVDHTKRH